MSKLKIYETVFIESSLQSPEYDGVILILYPEECNIEHPRLIRSFVDGLKKVDKQIYKVPTLWICDFVSGGRLILAPTGKITPYHDAKVIADAAKKGVSRALEAGMRKPLLVVPPSADFPLGQLVAMLGAFEALYVPIQQREYKAAEDFLRIGFHAEEKSNDAFENTIRNAISLENARIVARDIAGGDPERMSPVKIVEYIKETFKNDANITIKVIEDDATINEEYPLLAAVSRAASNVDRHKARVVEIQYKPSDLSRVSDTPILVGKGVTYDTGGADLKISGKMPGMSRDKSGAAAIVGFIKACALLKPIHLKVIGVLCLCRNSIGSESYVSDELIVSRSGKTVRVTNTDAEGRFAMADSLFNYAEMATNEMNPHLYTIATLTGHAAACYGSHTAAMDNFTARATNHATKLQFSGSKLGEGIEVSMLRPEDFSVNNGKCKGDDLVQIDTDVKSRNHQLAAAFLIRVGGLEDKNVKYTHLDIAGGARMPPEEPSAVPILTLCHLYKVLL